MDDIKFKSQEIKKSLRCLNKRAKKFMKPYSSNHLTWKLGYKYLVESEIWKSAKQLLLQYKFLISPDIVCSFCNQLVRQNSPVLHHKKYNRSKYFKPTYVTFAHYTCHDAYHAGKRRKIIPRYARNRMMLIITLGLFILLFFVFKYR